MQATCAATCRPAAAPVRQAPLQTSSSRARAAALAGAAPAGAAKQVGGSHTSPHLHDCVRAAAPVPCSRVQGCPCMPDAAPRAAPAAAGAHPPPPASPAAHLPPASCRPSPLQARRGALRVSAVAAPEKGLEKAAMAPEYIKAPGQGLGIYQVRRRRRLHGLLLVCAAASGGTALTACLPARSPSNNLQGTDGYMYCDNMKIDDIRAQSSSSPFYLYSQERIKCVPRPAPLKLLILLLLYLFLLLLLTSLPERAPARSPACPPGHPPPLLSGPGPAARALARLAARRPLQPPPADGRALPPNACRPPCSPAAAGPTTRLMPTRCRGWTRSSATL